MTAETRKDLLNQINGNPAWIHRTQEEVCAIFFYNRKISEFARFLNKTKRNSMAS
jgi:hypothetical protein